MFSFYIFLYITALRKMINNSQCPKRPIKSKRGVRLSPSTLWVRLFKKNSVKRIFIKVNKCPSAPVKPANSKYCNDTVSLAKLYERSNVI